MNTPQLRHGLGYDAIWDVLGPPPESPYPISTPPIFSSGSGHSTRDAILGTINNAVSSIFGNPNQNANRVVLDQSGRQVVVDSSGRVVATSPGSAVSQGIGSGLEATTQSLSNFFGVSPTTLLIGGAAGLYLLFRDPPRRR